MTLASSPSVKSILSKPTDVVFSKVHGGHQCYNNWCKTSTEEASQKAAHVPSVPIPSIDQVSGKNWTLCRIWSWALAVPLECRPRPGEVGEAYTRNTIQGGILNGFLEGFKVLHIIASSVCLYRLWLWGDLFRLYRGSLCGRKFGRFFSLVFTNLLE